MIDSIGKDYPEFLLKELESKRIRDSLRYTKLSPEDTTNLLIEILAERAIEMAYKPGQSTKLLDNVWLYNTYVAMSNALAKVIEKKLSFNGDREDEIRIQRSPQSARVSEIEKRDSFKD